jgi:hypothetical protein
VLIFWAIASLTLSNDKVFPVQVGGLTTSISLMTGHCMTQKRATAEDIASVEVIISVVHVM